MHELVRFAADDLLAVIVLGGGLLLLPTLRRNFWGSVPALVMAGLTSLLVGKLMSLIYQPAVARPFVELGVAPGAAYINNPGFPSDHALLATVVVVAVFFATKYKRLAAVLGVLTLIMCAARVAALVHTPLDVAGGIVAGLTGAIWYRKLTK